MEPGPFLFLDEKKKKCMRIKKRLSIGNIKINFDFNGKQNISFKENIFFKVLINLNSLW